MSEHTDLCAKWLESVRLFLKTGLSPESVLDACPTLEKNDNRDLFRLYEAVEHFNADSDIRAREPDYENAQLKTIERLYAKATAKPTRDGK